MTPQDYRRRAAELISQKNLTEGYKAALAACTAEPENGECWYLLGVVLQESKKWPAATASFLKAWALGSRTAWTATNIGWNIHLSGRSEEAERWLKLALEIDPNASLPHTNLSQVYYALGRPEMAVTEAKAGVLLAPDSHPAHHMALAFAAFAADDWELGFREYESRIRFKLPEIETYPIPRWRGEKTNHLFLISEQGFGDTLMAWRWVNLAAKRAEKVTVFVQPELYSLLAERGPANIEVHPLPKPLPSADAFAPLMSLPHILGSEALSVSGRFLPNDTKYTDNPSRIGLVWAGNSDHDMDRWRSCPFIDMAALSDIPGLELVSLQTGAHGSDLENNGYHGLIEDRSSYLSNFSDTANELKKLDLLICIDTATAHLAGSLGVKTWLLLGSHGTDWRWGLFSQRTRWYESVRIFRAQRNERWPSVIARVADALVQTQKEKAA